MAVSKFITILTNEESTSFSKTTENRPNTDFFGFCAACKFSKGPRGKLFQPSFASILSTLSDSYAYKNSCEIQ